MSLEPLSPQAVESMVLEMSGTAIAAESLADRLYEETEGNPFFLMEIIKSLFEAQQIVLEAVVCQLPVNSQSVWKRLQLS